MSALHQIRIKWVFKRGQISLLVPSFQRTYQQDSKQESEKAPGNLKVTLKKMGAKKMRAQWARLQSCKKNKTRLKKKTVAIYLKHVFNNHDPGILSMRPAATSEQQSMKNIKLPVTIYFIKIWAYRQQNQSFSYQGEPR